MMDGLAIRSLTAADVPAVQALLESVFPDARAWNQPAAYLPRKRAQGDDLLLVGIRGGRVVAAVALGYDGIRGCPKIDLQIVADNAAVAAFYARLGYAVEPRISMGKCLVQ